MKKVQLDFQKKVVSTLSGNDLSQLQGGNIAFSYNSCLNVQTAPFKKKMYFNA